MAAVVSDFAKCAEAFESLAGLGWIHAPEPEDERVLGQLRRR